MTEIGNSQPPPLELGPHKSWFARHIMSEILGILLFGAIAAGAYYYQVSQSEPVIIPPVHHEKVDTMANWKTYTNDQYGFELKTPVELMPLDATTGTGSVTTAGKTYQTIQLINNIVPDIKIIKGYTDVATDPYGNPPSSIASKVINGVTWHIFYNPAGGAPGCDQASFQTITKDGLDLIDVSFMDEEHCPGDPKTMPSVAYINQILSTFKFTTPSSVLDTSTWKTYTNSQYGFEFQYPPSITYQDKSSSSGWGDISFEDANKSSNGFNIKINNPGFGFGEGCLDIKTSSKLVNGIMMSRSDYCGLIVYHFKTGSNEFYILNSKILDKEYFDEKVLDQILSTFKFTP
ncbi:MAG: hypothetical protein ABI643_00525 [Candidatus Doudnabacteria bacterium]